MGDRYIITVICSECGAKHLNVWYAPTCGVKEFECPCGHVVDLEEYTGITEEQASNRDVILDAIGQVLGDMPDEIAETPYG